MASAGSVERHKSPSGSSPFMPLSNGKPPNYPSSGTEPVARWVSKEHALKRRPPKGLNNHGDVKQRVSWDWHARQWVADDSLRNQSTAADPLSEADANHWTAANGKSAIVIRHPLQRVGRPGGWVSEADGNFAEDVGAGGVLKRSSPASSKAGRRKGFYVADLQGRRKPLQRELLLLRKEKNIKKLPSVRPSFVMSGEPNCRGGSTLIDEAPYASYIQSPKTRFSNCKGALVSEYSNNHHGSVSAKKQTSLRLTTTYGSAVEAECDDDNDDTESFQSERSACGMPWHWPGSQRTRQDVQSDSGSGCFGVPKRGACRNRRGHKFGSERSVSSFDSDSESAPLMTDPEPLHEYSEDITASSVELSSESHVDGFQFKRYNTLDVQAWSDAKSGSRQEGKLRKQGAATTRKHRSLSQKYRPKLIKDIMGQAMVMESLSNAIVREKIAPVYLFHGPRGTGKTTAAKIFTAAMNCLSIEELRPCGLCAECASFNAGHSHDIKEVDAGGNNDVESMRLLLSNVSQLPCKSRYKVFIVDDCHTLSAEAWNALLKSLEEPPSFVVFILITTDVELIPRTAISRCQKFMFARIKETDIIHRLRKLALLEKIDIDMEALQFIASRSDGSLREAENLLDQLSLLGNRITLATAQEMVGLISDEKLAILLEWALSGDTVNTVNTIRELMETGVEPISLTSQLAALITDILGGKKRVIGVTTMKVREDEQARLKQALKILSDAEKQLRSCTDRTTWLTAAFLQFASHEPYLLPSSSRGTSAAPSPMTLFDASEKETMDLKSQESEERWDMRMGFHSAVMPSSPGHTVRGEIVARRQHSRNANCDSGPFFQGCEGFFPVSGRLRERIQRESSSASPCTMNNIWKKVIQGSHSNMLKQLLQEESRLVSISVTEAYSIAHLEFRQPEHKAMAERARANITKSFQMALGCPVEVEFSLLKSSDERSAIPRSKTPFIQTHAKVSSLQKNDSVSQNIECKIYSFKESFNSSRNITSAASSPLRRNIDLRRPRHGFEADRRTVGRDATDSSSKDLVFHERRKPTEEAAWAIKPHGRDVMDMIRRDHLKGGVSDAQGRSGHVHRRESNIQASTSLHEGVPAPSQMSETDLFHGVEDSSDSDGFIDREDPGALCWKGSRTGENKGKRQMRLRRRKGRLLLRFVLCAKGSGTKRQAA